MSLGIYASRSSEDIILTAEDRAAFNQLDLYVNEWIGTGSFGGKRYIELVERVTGVLLGYTWIPSETVARMAAAFEACDPEKVAGETRDDAYPASARDVRGLRDLLRAFADRGLGLYGM